MEIMNFAFNPDFFNIVKKAFLKNYKNSVPTNQMGPNVCMLMGI